MSKLAVDVVLLPPEEIVELAIGLNKTFVKEAEDEFTLNKKDFLPHITLAMGLMEEARKDAILERLSRVAQEVQPLHLALTGARAGSPRLDARKMSGLEIEKTPELQLLHERVLSEVISLCTYAGVTKSMFYPGTESVSEYWLTGKVQTNVREKYHPHITLGFGAVPEIKKPITFTASRLALCHLGIHCTCRKALASFELGAKKSGFPLSRE